MTKSTMITTIQEKELDLWENLKVVERVFGKDSIQANISGPHGIAFGA